MQRVKSSSDRRKAVKQYSSSSSLLGVACYISFTWNAGMSQAVPV